MICRTVSLSQYPPQKPESPREAQMTPSHPDGEHVGSARSTTLSTPDFLAIYQELAHSFSDEFERLQPEAMSPSSETIPSAPPPAPLPAAPMIEARSTQ